MNYRIISILILLIAIVVHSSCKKFVEVDGPSTSVSSKNVYNNDATAIGAITSLYVNLSKSSLISPQELTSLSCYAGSSADELEYYSGAGNRTLAVYFQNDLNSLNVGNDFWGKSYERLYIINAALEGLEASSGLTFAVKQHLIGEACFMRAFYYFYLVNLYGDIPLVLSTDYKINAVIKRTTKIHVYNQIITDLKVAQNLLSDRYLKGDGISIYSIGSEERVRPNKWAATALLARTYLFMGEWADAETQASIVLANTAQFQLEPLDKVFLKDSREAIWQLQPTIIGANTQDANTFLLPAEGPSFYNPVYLSKELINDFETEDHRKVSWTSSLNTNDINYCYPSKYKVKQSSVTNAPVIEYSTVMRLAELYLIRAESRTQLGKLSDAILDVDKIRKRAGLNLINDVDPIISKENLITLILKEKRLEFFTEWGHRWFDLKRVNMIDEVMKKVTPQKNNGATWKSYQQYYPISSYELQSNPNLTQVSGY